MSAGNDIAELERRVAELQRAVDVATEVAKALAAGEVDAVVNQAGSTPILLQVAQAQLREREQLLRAIFDGALDGTLLTDDRGRFADANLAACEIFGLPKESLLGRTIFEFSAPGYAPADEWKESFETGHKRGELSLLRPDGALRAVEFATVAHIVPGVRLTVLRDITERKAREVALREARYFLEKAESVAGLGSWVAPPDPDGVLFGTKEAYRIAGLPDGTPLTVRRFFELVVHPGDVDAFRLAIQNASELRTPLEVEHRIVRPDGEIRWVSSRAIFERDPNGVPIRMIGTIQDVTERRQAAEQMRVSEQRYRGIVETTSEGVWLADGTLTTTFVNERLAQMLGYRRDELIGQKVDRFIAVEGLQLGQAMIERRRKGFADTYENAYLRKDGTTLWGLVKSNALLDADGQFCGVVALLSDMTEHRKFEEARNRLAAIVESSAHAIISNTLEGTIASWNRAAEQLFGYSADEIIGQPITTIIPPDRAHEEHGILARVTRGERINEIDTIRCRKDGSQVEVCVNFSPILDGGGRVVGVSTVAHDITERRKHEAVLRRSEQQLRQSQKLEAVGSLAGGIAHDFNNILSVILSYTRLLIDEFKPSDPIRADLEEIDKAGVRAAELTRQLLAFSRQQMLQPHVLDLNKVIEAMRKMLARTLGEDIVLGVLPSVPLGKVYADAGQVEQVLMNLVINARDAMPRGGTVTIETSDVVVDAANVAEDDGLEPGSYVLLAVTDTGTGIDPAALARIFDPFFTTKEEGRGTGLGLATVHGIVEQSGGAIRVQSTVGVGTTFKLYLPRSDRERESHPMSVAGPSSYRGTETILLVEDEDQLRTVMRSALRKLGYEVLEAQNGGEAFLICEQRAATIHLLLTDVVMPRMSGRELAERLHPLRPEMRVLYVSGYTRDAAVMVDRADDPGSAFLAKPLTPELLAKKVREVLDAAPRDPWRPSAAPTA